MLCCSTFWLRCSGEIQLLHLHLCHYGWIVYSDFFNGTTTVSIQCWEIVRIWTSVEWKARTINLYLWSAVFHRKNKYCSDTYQRIQTKRNQKWNYERYALVREFQRVPVIPMPLGTLIYIHYIFQWIYKKCRKCAVVDNVHSGKDISDFSKFNTIPRYNIIHWNIAYELSCF